MRNCRRDFSADLRRRRTSSHEVVAPHGLAAVRLRPLRRLLEHPIPVPVQRFEGGSRRVAPRVLERALRLAGGRQAMKSWPRTVLRPFTFARFATCSSTQYMYPFSASKAAPAVLHPAFWSAPFALRADVKP